MVSGIVRGASISKLYVPAYEDYVVGEQSLEWRLEFLESVKPICMQ